MDAVQVRLPRGICIEGEWYHTASLWPLCGRDEAFLCDEGRALWSAQRTTALLVRCLHSLGPLAPVPSEAVRALTIGDREALLLHLRRLTLGERIACLLSCPDPACGEQMDLDLQVHDLLLPPPAQVQEWYETAIAGQEATYNVRFRLPTGADQEVAVRLSAATPETGAALLLQRCLACVHDTNGTPVDPPPATVISQLPALMAELDPQAELRLRLTCPVCDGVFSTLFDTASYFFQELSSRTGQIYREVHWLAFYYHWSEAEILAMTRQKRQRYLSLLAEALSEGRG